MIVFAPSRGQIVKLVFSSLSKNELWRQVAVQLRSFFLFNWLLGITIYWPLMTGGSIKEVATVWLYIKTVIIYRFIHVHGIYTILKHIQKYIPIVKVMPGFISWLVSSVIYSVNKCPTVLFPGSVLNAQITDKFKMKSLIVYQ